MVSTKQVIKLRLEPSHYEDLKAQAERLGLRLGTFARICVLARLAELRNANS